MSTSNRVRLRDLKNIYRLIGECRELGDDSQAWRRHMFERLCRLVGAQVGCGGEVRGFWTEQPEVLENVDLGWAGECERSRYFEFLQRHGAMETPEFLYRRQRPHARLITGCREQCIDDRQWYRSEHFNEYRRISRVDSNLFSLATIPGARSPQPAPDRSILNGITLHRELGEPRFQKRERLILHWFHHELLPLLGRQLALAEEPSASELSPRLREVLDCLLEGDSEKQVALRLGLTRQTVHQYVKTVYNHFGVQSRGELLARWIRRRR